MKFFDACQKLKNAGIENYRHEAMLLCERLCGSSPAKLLADPLYECNEEFESAVCRRCEGEPLQYIIGEWDFFGSTFYVKEGCLIPREDTELLVERALYAIPEGAHFADLCSGSGCIGISVLKNRPDLRCTSFDLYETPLSLTSLNAEQNGVSERIDVKCADILSDFELPNDISFILSNPPYIRSGVIPSLSSDVRHEPISALDGGEDGLIFYRAILDICASRRIPALLEIGYDQADDLSALCAERQLTCRIYKDFSDNDRVAEITFD